MVLATACLLATTVAVAQETDATGRAERGEFITLGTIGGPMPNPARSQPANALVVGEAVYLVDAGDGAADQLAAAGLPLTSVRAVFLSHLHFDHIGGLFALLGLRAQVSAPGTLTVYGPPGTRALVDGLQAAMKPSLAAAYGLPGQTWTTAIAVEELHTGSRVALADLEVSVAENTHYSFPPESDEARRYKSLSLRFDLPARSIVYTGDTTASPAVEKLAAGADLLVSEIIDYDKVIAAIERQRPDLPAAELRHATEHLSKHHLSPEQVGELAGHADVKAVVITHQVPAVVPDDTQAEWLDGIRKSYSGKVFFAQDLDRY
jgi:ribonuclease BN (tRNA processing enzyme)